MRLQLAASTSVSYTHLHIAFQFKIVILPEMDIQLAVPNIDFPLLEALAPAVAVLAGNIIAKHGLLISEQRFFQFHRQTAAELVAIVMKDAPSRFQIQANAAIGASDYFWKDGRDYLTSLSLIHI